MSCFKAVFSLILRCKIGLICGEFREMRRNESGMLVGDDDGRCGGFPSHVTGLTRGVRMDGVTDDDGACNAGCDLISLVRPKFSSVQSICQRGIGANWETESRILVAVAPSRRKNSIRRAMNESTKGGRVTSPVEWAGGRL